MITKAIKNSQNYQMQMMRKNKLLLIKKKKIRIFNKFKIKIKKFMIHMNQVIHLMIMMMIQKIPKKKNNNNNNKNKFKFSHNQMNQIVMIVLMNRNNMTEKWRKSRMINVIYIFLNQFSIFIILFRSNSFQYSHHYILQSTKILIYINIKLNKLMMKEEI